MGADWFFEKNSSFRILKNKNIKIRNLYGEVVSKVLDRITINALSFKERVQYFLDRVREVHGDKYSYENMGYVRNKEKINITCKIHGVFVQTPHDHLKGRGCPDCSGKKQSNTKEFIEKAKVLHRDTYDYSKTVYNRVMDKVDIICKKHGLFSQRADSHLSGHGCRLCTDRKSGPELELIGIMTNKLPYNTIETSISPTWMNSSREVDIYIPEKKFAIEYNGDYWHSEKFSRGKEYHIYKSNQAKNAGITLLHVWDSRWNSGYRSIYMDIIDKVISGNVEEVRHLIDDNVWIFG